MKEDVMSEPEKVERWVAVETVANETEAALLAGYLQSEGIPAQVMDRSFHLTPMPEDDELSPIAVAVPADRVAEAEQLLARREAEFRPGEKDADGVLADEGPEPIDADASSEKPKSGG
jgi:hypothetical protein